MAKTQLTFKCDGCGTEEPGHQTLPPTGWYDLNGSPRELEPSFLHHWHVCSALCLGALSRQLENESTQWGIYRSIGRLRDRVEALEPKPAPAKAVPAKKPAAKKAAPRKRAAA